MQVDVIVMAEKTIQSIMDWQLRPDHKDELRAVYVDGSGQPPIKAWDDLALRIYSRALEGKHAPSDIFLYLRDGLHRTIPDYGTLRDIVADARNHVVGGKLYVVWDKLNVNAFVDNFREDSSQIQRANAVLLAECFCALLQGGVTDIVEIERQEWAQVEGSFDKKKIMLRGYAVASERRQQELAEVVSEGGWGYVLRNEAWLLESLLKELTRESGFPCSGPNHLVVFDAVPSRSSGGPKGLLEKFRRINPDQRGIVAATLEGYSRELSLQCNNAIPLVRLVKFNGIFEVMYALLQLNRLNK